MSDPNVAELDFARAADLLRGLGPRGTEVIASDATGQTMWSSCGSLEPELMRSLRELCERRDGPTSADPEVVRSRLGERGVLLSSPLRAHGGAAVAWLSIWGEWIDDTDPSSEQKRVSETLPRAAAFLEKEYRLQSELVGAVNELSDRYEELNLVFNLEHQARADDRQSSALQAMLANFTQHLGVDVAVFAAPEHGAPIHALAGQRRIPNLDLVLVELRGRLWRFLAASKKLFVLNEAEDPRRAYLLTHLPFKAIAIPSLGCNSVDGGLMLLRHIDEPDFTNSEVSLAQVFVGQAMIMLKNHSLNQRMKLFTRQMASSLVEAVEAKDPYTRGHSERVELITAGLGKSVSLDAAELEDLLWGALLHDIGKIGVPDSILLKPGPLTEDEYTFIKTHPERSYEILQHIDQLGDSALAGARYHQERYDGQGYPFGLRAEEIPLPARIVSVADTYDAVTSSRSYRSACGHDRAMEIIRECSGSQLDPDLVDSFCALVERDSEWLSRIRPQRDGDVDDE